VVSTSELEQSSHHVVTSSPALTMTSYCSESIERYFNSLTAHQPDTTTSDGANTHTASPATSDVATDAAVDASAAAAAVKQLFRARVAAMKNSLLHSANNHQHVTSHWDDDLDPCDDVSQGQLEAERKRAAAVMNLSDSVRFELTIDVTDTRDSLRVSSQQHDDVTRRHNDVTDSITFDYLADHLPPTVTRREHCALSADLRRELRLDLRDSTEDVDTAETTSPHHTSVQRPSVSLKAATREPAVTDDDDDLHRVDLHRAEATSLTAVSDSRRQHITESTKDRATSDDNNDDRVKHDEDVELSRVDVDDAGSPSQHHVITDRAGAVFGRPKSSVVYNTAAVRASASGDVLQPVQSKARPQTAAAVHGVGVRSSVKSAKKRVAWSNDTSSHDQQPATSKPSRPPSARVLDAGRHIGSAASTNQRSALSSDDWSVRELSVSMLTCCSSTDCAFNS